MSINFTAQELSEILDGLDIPGGFYDMDRLMSAIEDSIDVDGIKDALSKTIFSGAATPEALAAADALAERQARKIATALSKTSLNSIADKVKQNIAEGNAFDGLYAKLDEIKGLDSGRAKTLQNFKDDLEQKAHLGLNNLTQDEINEKVQKLHDKLLRDRKMVIAQTEQRMATEDGAAEIAKQRGAKYKRWITAGDDLVSDMDESNEAQGWIPFDEEFSSGDNQPPSHPRCRCTVTYRVTEPDRFDEQRAKDAAQATSEAKAGA